MSRGSVKEWRGSWMFAIRVDTTAKKRRQLQRRGWPSKAAATRALEHVRDLLKVAGDDDEYRALIGDRIFASPRGQLPTLDEMRRLKDANVDPSQRPVTVGEWLSQWLELRGHDEDASPGSRFIREHHVEIWWRPHLGAVRLDRLTDTHIRRVRTWVLARNEAITQARAAGAPVPADPLDVRTVPRVLSDATWNQVLGTLGAALNEAQRRGLLVRNPVKLVSRPRVDRKRPKAWTAEEVRAFIAFVYEADPWLAPLFELALRRGLRRGELLGLRWGDIDWRAGYVQIRRQRVDNDGHVQETTKTSSSTREVPLGRELVAHLRELHLRRGRPGDGEWVFLDRLGRLPNPPQVTQYFGRLVRRAGLPKIKLHNCRHTALTLLIEAGVPVKHVAAIAGHSSVRTTIEVYQAVTRGNLDDAVQKIDALLDPEGVVEVARPVGLV